MFLVSYGHMAHPVAKGLHLPLGQSKYQKMLTPSLLWFSATLDLSNVLSIWLTVSLTVCSFGQC